MTPLLDDICRDFERVEPAIVVIADGDGAVVVEKGKAASLLAPAEKKLAEERRRITEINGGGAIRPDWLESALRTAGVLKDGERL